MSADRFATRIETLDPESRAIVELSLVRGFSDDDLAGMLGTSADRVGERRERALEHLGARTARDRDAVVVALRENGAEAAEPEGAEPEGSEPEGAAAPDAAEPEAAPDAAQPEAPRRRALLLAIVGGVLIAVAIGVTLALAGGETEPEPISSGQGAEEAAPQEPPAEESPPAAEESPPADEESPPPADDAPPEGEDLARLQPPAGGEATGTVELVPAEGDGGRRLVLTVRGLGPRRRAGGYGIWLYDSVSEARMIAGSTRGTFRAQVRLPPEADRYEFLDVSYEPPDGNRNHSGASLLRVPLAEVLGG